MTPAEKRAYRAGEKKAAARLADHAQRLVDARGHAEVYLARVLLNQSIRELVLLADSTYREHRGRAA